MVSAVEVGADVGEFSDEPVAQGGHSRERSLGGVEPHAVLVKGFVVRVVPDGPFDDRDCGGRISVGEQIGEGEVRVDGLSAGGFPDRRYPVVVVVGGQRAGVGGDRRVQRRSPGIGSVAVAAVWRCRCSRHRSLSTRSGSIMMWPRVVWVM